MASKELIVGGGPNGAGKTTFAEHYVASSGARYIAADAIAAELSPADPAKAQIAASREFIRRTEEALSGDGHFVIESTLSGRTFARLLEMAKEAGFDITILYLFIDSIETCLDRVQSRVRRGGQDVPEDDVRRRYLRSLRNFWHLYRPLADRWTLIYNSGSQPQNIAVGSLTGISISDEDRFSQFEQLAKVST